MSWIQFSADPVPLLQLWDIVHGLPLGEQDSLSVAQAIRSFLTNDSLIDAGQVLPKNDPLTDFKLLIKWSAGEVGSPR